MVNHRTEDLVTCLVTVPVIYGLEIVKVHIRYGERMLISLEAVNLRLREFEEGPRVSRAGQVVRMSQFPFV